MMFSHIDEQNQPTMVDVGDKAITEREAIAQSLVYLPDEVMKHFSSGDIKSKKGPVIQTAIIAATLAVKKTHELIPFCHPLKVESIKVEITKSQTDNHHLQIHCRVKCQEKTGVEMEALTGATVAALTVYDMVKSFSHDIRIVETKLLKKTGGKSDYRS